MLAVLVFVGSLDEGEIWADDHSHIVVIPDVHGDVDALLRSLWLAQKKIEPDRVVEFSDFMRGFQAVMDSVGFASDSASPTDRQWWSFSWGIWWIGVHIAQAVSS